MKDLIFLILILWPIITFVMGLYLFFLYFTLQKLPYVKSLLRSWSDRK